MQVTMVEINVKPNKLNDFIRVFRKNHLGSIKEPGNLRFDVLQDEEIKTRFYIYEAYTNEEAVIAHKKTKHYLKCVEELESIMSEPRKKVNYVGIMPELE